MESSTTAAPLPSKTSYGILIIMGICHLLNDSLQAVVPAMFPILETSLGLSYTQLGLIAFSLNMVASVMQPIFGWYTDSFPLSYALPLGMGSTLFGMLLLGLAPSYTVILFSVMLIGIGSAIFHPAGSRVAFMAGGTRRGLAQSIYQVGGNTGQALAPLITAIILLPYGQKGALWFVPVALLAVFLLVLIANWYKERLSSFPIGKKVTKQQTKKPEQKIYKALGIVLFLIFARSWYISCMTNFYAFYLIHDYHFTIRSSQLYLFAFLAAGALGTFLGGPLADRFGRKNIIFFSLAGNAPFTIILPYVSSSVIIILLLLAGFVIMTSFSVTVIYAQELFPGKVGTMAGLTVGFAFGMGAVGSVVLGMAADLVGITSTIKWIGFLPLLGIFTLLLPSDTVLKRWHQE